MSDFWEWVNRGNNLVGLAGVSGASVLGTAVVVWKFAFSPRKEVQSLKEENLQLKGQFKELTEAKERSQKTEEAAVTLMMGEQQRWRDHVSGIAWDHTRALKVFPIWQGGEQVMVWDDRIGVWCAIRLVNVAPFDVVVDFADLEWRVLLPGKKAKTVLVSGHFKEPVVGMRISHGAAPELKLHDGEVKVEGKLVRSESVVPSCAGILTVSGKLKIRLNQWDTNREVPVELKIRVSVFSEQTTRPDPRDEQLKLAQAEVSRLSAELAIVTPALAEMKMAFEQTVSRIFEPDEHRHEGGFINPYEARGPKANDD